MKLSVHADKRLQQRGLNSLAIELILQYGRETHQGDGATFVQLDKKGFKKLCKDFHLVYQKLNKLRNVFVVDGGEEVITAAYQYRHLHKSKN